MKQIEVNLPEPSADPDVLLAPLQSKLESLRLPAAVERIEVTLRPCASGPGQHQLFGHSIRQPHRLADTLIRLSALLGDDRIGFPVPHFSHRPDSFHLAPAQRLFQGSVGSLPTSQTQPSPNRRKATQPTTSLPAIALATEGHNHASGPPLARFRPPLEIAVAFDPPRRGHPQPLALLTGPHRGRITALHGPFPISGHWWSPADAWQQLEWDILLETRHLLRLSHTPPDLWHLQGHYA